MTRRNPGLDAREKLTCLVAESEIKAPDVHLAMMSHTGAQVKRSR